MAAPSYTDNSVDRLTQIVSNLNGYYSREPNANYFNNWDSFANQFSYNSRTPEQQQVLKSWYDSKFGGGNNQTTNISSVPQSSYSGGSIVDYLNSIGYDSSFSNRQRLASQYGISNYSGTAAQNTQLLNAMRSGSSRGGTGLPGQGDGSIPTGMGSGINKGTNLNEPINYENTKRDYQTDDPNRLQEIRNNIEKGYVNTNPELFQNRQKFDDFFHYNERGDAQRAILDELFEKYNKSDAAPFETQILEQEKNFEQEKRDEKLGALQDIIDQLNNKRDEIEGKMNDRLRDARNNVDNIANTYMTKLGEIQDLYDEYFPKARQAMQEKMAGEMAGLTSEMSAKKMSGLLRNSLYGIQQNYNKLFNNLMAEQGELLKALNDGYGNFMLELQRERDNLDNNEYNMLVTGYNNLKATLDALSQAQQQSIDEINRAWENWYKTRSDTVAEEAGTNAKKQTKNAAYKGMDFYSRAQYLTDNLVKIIGDGTTLDNYNYNVIKYAAENYNDLTEALNYIAQNAKYQNKSGSSSSSGSSTSGVDSEIKSIWEQVTADELRSMRDGLG